MRNWILMEVVMAWKIFWDSKLCSLLQLIKPDIYKFPYFLFLIPQRLDHFNSWELCWNLYQK